jgi:hypothetical protein
MPLILLGLAAFDVTRAAQAGKSSGPLKGNVVLRGRMTISGKSFAVFTWQTFASTPHRPIAHLSVEATEKRRTMLFQVDGSDGSFQSIGSVSLADLDGDGTPEILSLWSQGPATKNTLRVFHWDGSQFTEAEASQPIVNVRSFDANRGRIKVVYISNNRGNGPSEEYELNGSRLVRSGGGKPVTTAESGIEGQCLISPTRPGPIREGESGTAPYKTTLVITRTSDGQAMANIESGEDGRFRVALPPGEYQVAPAQPRRFPRAQGEVVRVAAGKFTRVTISFDSGMR